MRCDIRIAAADALFGLPEVAIGIVNCEVPLANQSIPLCVLMELSMTAESAGAARALQVAMVNKVVSNERLMDEAMETARAIARHSPIAVRLSKENLPGAVAVSEKVEELRNDKITQ